MNGSTGPRAHALANSPGAPRAALVQRGRVALPCRASTSGHILSSPTREAGSPLFSPPWAVCPGEEPSCPKHWLLSPPPRPAAPPAWHGGFVTGAWPWLCPGREGLSRHRASPAEHGALCLVRGHSLLCSQPGADGHQRPLARGGVTSFGAPNWHRPGWQPPAAQGPGLATPAGMQQRSRL